MYYMYYITYQYFSKFEYNVFAWDWTRTTPDHMWTLYHWAMKDYLFINLKDWAP